MINKQLIGYIKQQLGEGVDKDEIKNILLSSGWTNEDVDEAFLLTTTPVPSVPEAEAPSLEVSSVEATQSIDTPSSRAPISATSATLAVTA